MADTKLMVDLDFAQNEAQNMVVQNLASAPANPKIGQIYYNSTQNLAYAWNGTAWVNLMAQGSALTPATTTTLGGVIIGDNVSVAGDGTISVADASTSTKGVIEIATDSEASTGTDTTRAINAKQLATKLTANAAITSGTYTKVTVDTKGLVTSGATLVASDIPDISATYIAVTQKGVANGVASLDSTGKVPTAQLPSFVDDVVDSYIVSGATALSAGWLSATDGGSALTPETGKIYVILTTGEYLNKTYRWSGSTYVEISASPAQATESTAGIARIATTAEVTAGSDDTTIVTPAKLAAKINGVTYKQVETNPTLTATGGVCTWTISTTLTDAIVSVKEIATGDEVIVGVTHGSGTITITMNSASNIASGTLKAVLIG